MSVRFLDTGEFQEAHLCDDEVIALETIKASLLSLQMVLAATKERMGARKSVSFHSDLSDITQDHISEVEGRITAMEEAR